MTPGMASGGSGADDARDGVRQDGKDALPPHHLMIFHLRGIIYVGNSGII